MNHRFEKLISQLSSIHPEYKERLESIEMKSQFRAPEVQFQSWVELSILVKSLPVEKIAVLLSEQFEGITFSADEKLAISRALRHHRKHINDVALKSNKISDKDRQSIELWLNDNESASEKVEQDLFS
ncbi:MAG: hypothetical protein ACE3L7_07320 [Candidatus Pristimantibacillus sp.]